MSDVEDAIFTVWGCRGSQPAPGADFARYGGETTCYELKSGRQRIWIDAGSGLRGAAAQWATEGKPNAPVVLLSHFHLDHLLGLGVFAQHLSADRPATLLCCGDPAEAEATIRRLFSPPFWPVDLMASGKFRLAAYQFGSRLRLGEAVVDPFPLNHPGGCAGFEIEIGGARVVIAADHEHGVAEIDDDVARRAAGADLVVYDGAYSEAQYCDCRGWGHSTREQGVNLALAAGPRRLLLSHHDPSTVDDVLAEAEAKAAAQCDAVRLARDGLRVALSGEQSSS